MIEMREKEFWKCELCAAFATPENAQKLGWDWFTGRLPRTHHYCPKCKTQRVHDEMMKTAGVS